MFAKPNVLYLMAGGTKREEARRKRLGMLFVVIFPDLVTLHRPFRAAPAADLALASGSI